MMNTLNIKKQILFSALTTAACFSSVLGLGAVSLSAVRANEVEDAVETYAVVRNLQQKAINLFADRSFGTDIRTPSPAFVLPSDIDLSDGLQLENFKLPESYSVDERTRFNEHRLGKDILRFMKWQLRKPVRLSVVNSVGKVLLATAGDIDVTTRDHIGFFNLRNEGDIDFSATNLTGNVIILGGGDVDFSATNLNGGVSLTGEGNVNFSATNLSGRVTIFSSGIVNFSTTNLASGLTFSFSSAVSNIRKINLTFENDSDEAADSSQAAIISSGIRITDIGLVGRLDKNRVRPVTLLNLRFKGFSNWQWQGDLTIYDPANTRVRFISESRASSQVMNLQKDWNINYPVSFVQDDQAAEDLSENSMVLITSASATPKVNIESDLLIGKGMQLYIDAPVSIGPEATLSFTLSDQVRNSGRLQVFVKEDSALFIPSINNILPIVGQDDSWYDIILSLDAEIGDYVDLISVVGGGTLRIGDFNLESSGRALVEANEEVEIVLYSSEDGREPTSLRIKLTEEAAQRLSSSAVDLEGGVVIAEAIKAVEVGDDEEETIQEGSRVIDVPDSTELPIVSEASRREDLDDAAEEAGGSRVIDVPDSTELPIVSETSRSDDEDLDDAAEGTEDSRVIDVPDSTELPIVSEASRRDDEDLDDAAEGVGDSRVIDVPDSTELPIVSEASRRDDEDSDDAAEEAEGSRVIDVAGITELPIVSEASRRSDEDLDDTAEGAEDSRVIDVSGITELPIVSETSRSDDEDLDDAGGVGDSRVIDVPDSTALPIVSETSRRDDEDSDDATEEAGGSRVIDVPDSTELPIVSETSRRADEDLDDAAGETEGSRVIDVPDSTELPIVSEASRRSDEDLDDAAEGTEDSRVIDVPDSTELPIVTETSRSDDEDLDDAEGAEDSRVIDVPDSTELPIVSEASRRDDEDLDDAEGVGDIREVQVLAGDSASAVVPAVNTDSGMKAFALFNGVWSGLPLGQGMGDFTINGDFDVSFYDGNALKGKVMSAAVSGGYRWNDIAINLGAQYAHSIFGNEKQHFVSSVAAVSYYKDNGLRAGGYLGGGSTFASPDARKLSAILAGANFAYQVRFEDIPQVPMLDIDLLPGGKADVALAFMSGNTKKPIMYLNGEVGVDMTLTYLDREQLPDLSLSLTLPVKAKFGMIYDARGQAGKYTLVPAFKSGLGLRVSYQETYSVKIGYEVELSREYIRNGVVFSLQFSE